MARSSQRRSDVQLIAVTGGLLIGAAVLVAAGLLFATRGADSPECPLLRAGSLSDIEELVELGPVLQTGGEGCAYWLDSDGRSVVAYRVEARDSSCSLEASTNEQLVTTYSCGGKDVDPATLDRYPTWFPIENGVETLLVDLRPDRPCDAYDLGLADGLRDRLDDGGAVLISTLDCGDLWLAPDGSGTPAAVVIDTADCTIERDEFGRLRCNGEEVDAARVPAYPSEVVTLDDGDHLVVDLTAPPQ